MEKFLNGRSKILFATAIINAIVFLLFIPELVEYSKYMSNISMLNPEFIRVIPTMIFYVIGGHAFIQFNFTIILILLFAALANVVGFVYKKEEFNFMAMGLYLMISCMSLYVFHPFGILLLVLLFLLTCIGYVDQYAIKNDLNKMKKTKKSSK